MKQCKHPLLGLPARLLLALILLAPVQLSLAQDFVWAPDFPVGATIPDITTQDSDGALRNFDDLVGEKGLLFMMSRSFDW